MTIDECVEFVEKSRGHIPVFLTGAIDQLIKAVEGYHDDMREQRQTYEGIIERERAAIQQLSGVVVALRHGCLASLGFLGGVSILSKEQLQKVLVDAVKASGSQEKWSSG
jgi:hypothetical protein